MQRYAQAICLARLHEQEDVQGSGAAVTNLHWSDCSGSWPVKSFRNDSRETKCPHLQNDHHTHCVGSCICCEACEMWWVLAHSLC